MAQADVIVHDALVSDGILALAGPNAGLIHAGKPGGKPPAKLKDISLRLVDPARKGKRVLRLQGGDPFVFGRGGEEGQTLVQHGVNIRIIPGISTGTGRDRRAGLCRHPVTHRDVNQAVTFVTGPDQQVLEATLGACVADVAARKWGSDGRSRGEAGIFKISGPFPSKETETGGE